MAALNLSDANLLLLKTKLIVNGYIRNVQESLSISIPSGLIVLFLLFYGDQIDKFDSKHLGRFLKLTNNDLTISNTVPYQQGNAFGTIVCDKGMYQWKFKINRIQMGYIVIGIWRIKEDEPPPTDIFFTKGNERGYGFYLEGEKLSITHGGKTNKPTEQYGKKCVTGDIVHMILDLYAMTLSFKVNDVDYGAAYDNIKEAKYRAAVWLYESSDSVTIIE